MDDRGWLWHRLPTAWHLLKAAGQGWQGPWSRAGAVHRGPAGAPQVSLTFDDGPDPRWTPPILDALEACGVRATFFFLAAAIGRHPDLARRAAQNHEIGTHLYTHSRAVMRDRRVFEDDLARALRIHADVLGRCPTLLRFPFGFAGRIRAEDLRGRRMTAVHWTFSSQDYRAATAMDVLRQVLPRLKPGAIILFHDGRGENSRHGPGHRQATVEALPQILAALEEQRLKGVTVSDLLGQGADRDEPRAASWPRRPERPSHATACDASLPMERKP